MRHLSATENTVELSYSEDVKQCTVVIKNMSVQRMPGIDFLRGILIVSVVLGHVTIESSSLLSLKQIIYVFHMPFLFGLSILFIKDGDFKQFLRNNLRILLVFLLWTVFYGLDKPVEEIFWSLIWGNWYYLKSPLWFLPALFSLRILFYISKSGILRLIIMILSLGVTYYHEAVENVHSHIPWGLDIALYLFAPLYIGKKVFHRRVGSNSKLDATKISFLVILVCVFCITTVVDVDDTAEFPHRLDLAQFTVLSGLPYALLFTMVLSFFILSSTVKSKCYYVDFLGRNSMIIYLMHLPIIGLSSSYIVGSVPVFPAIVIMMWLAITLPLVFSFMFHRMRLPGLKLIGF